MKFKKINLGISGCMGRMGQQIIKSARLDNNFKIIALTEARIIKKKINGIQINLNEENSNSSVFSALNLVNNEHQEIKTRINHNTPHCHSYQKVKNVLNDESKGVYQGKIFVKNIAQKTDAYQLSKAILLNDRSEFNAKPELEIYADDVKCSHGSSSGNLDENSIFYLMSRGLSRKESIKLLINGFLNEVIDEIKSNSIKNFIQNKLEGQLNEHKKH